MCKTGRAVAADGPAPGFTLGGVNVFLRMITSAQCRWARLREGAEGERGATAVEYAIMLAFIAAVIVSAVAFLGSSTNTHFSSFNSSAFGGGS